jgi:hypothetical protein
LRFKTTDKKVYYSDNYFIISVWSRAMKLIMEEWAAILSFTCGAKRFEQALIESTMNDQM